MGAFKSVKTFHAPASLIPGIADEINRVLKDEGYTVKSSPLIDGGFDISIAKGNMFKAVLGMKTALKVSIMPQDNGIYMEAGVGIFGQQAIPTIIMLYFCWPVLLAQIWGMVQQSKLDNRVINLAESYIASRRTGALAEPVFAAVFCTSCGKPQPEGMSFCGNCGTKLI